VFGLIMEVLELGRKRGSVISGHGILSQHAVELSPRPLETVHASKGGLAQSENVCLCLETY